MAWRAVAPSRRGAAGKEQHKPRRGLRRQRSASAALPAQPARAARRVLRRCAKAASMTAKTASRVAVVAGGSLRVKATSPEWILGAGQKTFIPITPALRMLLYQAAFTEGTPYVLEPGG